jgi:hypothetical protein
VPRLQRVLQWAADRIVVPIVPAGA